MIVIAKRTFAETRQVNVSCSHSSSSAVPYVERNYNILPGKAAGMRKGPTEIIGSSQLLFLSEAFQIRWRLNSASLRLLKISWNECLPDYKLNIFTMLARVDKGVGILQICHKEGNEHQWTIFGR